MVKIINQPVCRGVAGKRPGKPKGVVIHNDAGSMSAEQYVNWLKGHNLELGFAHYYGDRNTMARVEDTFNMAWHTGNAEGNAWYIGFEVCQSMSASDADFLANEQAVFKQAAEDLKYYGLPVNRDTVRLHKEFSPTSCPHRSWDLHGRSFNSVKDYFISQIKRYYNGEKEKPVAKKVVYQDKTGWYEALRDDSFYCEKELKRKSRWNIKKGTVIYVDKIEKIGKYTRARVGDGRHTRYCTLRDDFWKYKGK